MRGSVKASQPGFSASRWIEFDNPILAKLLGVDFSAGGGIPAALHAPNPESYQGWNFGYSLDGAISLGTEGVTTEGQAFFRANLPEDISSLFIRFQVVRQ